jgi:hypothetical protein
MERVTLSANVEQNKKNRNSFCIESFRKATLVLGYEKFATEMIQKRQLQSFQCSIPMK